MDVPRITIRDPDVNSTSLSLLQRLREDPQAAGWEELVSQYGPLVRFWLKRNGVSAEDADDVAQEVMTVLVRRIAEFQRQRTGSFRRWMRNVAVNCMREHWRRNRHHAKATGGSDLLAIMHQLEDDCSSLTKHWELEHEQYLLGILLDRIRGEFQPATWQAFTLVVIEKLAPSVAAEKLGMTVNAVLIAKSRVLKRLREEGTGLIDA